MFPSFYCFCCLSGLLAKELFDVWKIKLFGCFFVFLVLWNVNQHSYLFSSKNEFGLVLSIGKSISLSIKHSWTI